MVVAWPALVGALLVTGGVVTLAVVFTSVVARVRQGERTRLQVLAWARYEVVLDSPGLWSWDRGTAQVKAFVEGRLRDCVVREQDGQPWVGLPGTSVEADLRPLT